MSPVFWEDDRFKPEGANDLSYMIELVRIHWLGNKAVRMIRVGTFDIFRTCRTGEDNHWKASQLGAGLDHFQYFEAAHSRHVQVEEDDVRSRFAGVVFFLSQVEQCLFAIGDNVEIVGDVAFSKNFQHQPDITRIVFHQQDIERAFDSQLVVHSGSIQQFTAGKREFLP